MAKLRIVRSKSEWASVLAKPARHHFAAVAYEKDRKRFNGLPGFSEEMMEELKIAPKSFHKTVHAAEGYGQGRVYVAIRPRISAFHLHEALRSAYPTDRDVGSIVVSLVELDAEDQRLAIEALGALSVLANWCPESYGKRAQKDAKKKKGPIEAAFWIHAKGGEKELQGHFDSGRAQAEATNFVRTLADLPGNILTPGAYVKRAREEAKALKAGFEFIPRDKLKRMGANAFLSVISANPDSDCGIAHLSHRPKGKTLGKLALVGKGICFDTGGYDVKVSGHMYSMHRDMTGSAVALALFRLIVRLKLPIEVDAYLAIAENLISPSAYRPNDVVIARNGLSIEVVDTDAEGRMVLSDTLAIASEGRPDLMLDFATLTGACVRALDTRRSGVFSNHARLLKLGMESGDRSGERVWGFPIGDDYWKGIESEIADVRQCATGNHSDHIYAATFLSAFVGESIDWIHMDLSAESNKGGLGLAASETTGFGVRWAYDVIQRYFRK